MKKAPLLSPYDLGPYEIPSRVIMAPLTRRRAGKNNVPKSMMVTYYSQRAGAGMAIPLLSQRHEPVVSGSCHHG